MPAYGLATHIWNNNLKSLLLLAGFPVLLLLLTYGLFLLFAGLGGFAEGDSLGGPFIWAAHEMARAWPFALIGAGVWFTLAYFFHQTIIDLAVGGRKVERKEQPELYNALENLCISRGITTPGLRIIDTPALNAFASGIREGHYTVTVTSGLVETLTKEELEAVLAHELTHVRNADVRMLVIAVIFVGIFSFVAEIVFRGIMNSGVSVGRRSSSSSSRSSSSSSDSGKGGGGFVPAIVVALVLIALAYALAMVIRFSLSRRREFLADAGAVELTKNPDALISALRKISGHADIPRAPGEVREMFIENDSAHFAGLFATHPPIEKRIEALVRYAGGRDIPPGEPPVKSGPWGAPAPAQA
ncbi:MAG TPA: M48 family metallopeptidase [Caulobacterales bacterium]|jgi:heat shock protein HtpX|nr:M48 family metallopeptidase [Caulobacterales bacterium]